MAAPTHKQLVRERREKIIRSLLDCVTGHDVMSAEELYHWVFVAGAYDVTSLVDKFAAEFDRWPEVRQEVLVALLIATLQKLA